MVGLGEGVGGDGKGYKTRRGQNPSYFPPLLILIFIGIYNLKAMLCVSLNTRPDSAV